MIEVARALMKCFGTLADPAHARHAHAVEHESTSFTLAQTAARVFLTLGLMVSMSALFASQVYFMLR